MKSKLPQRPLRNPKKLHEADVAIKAASVSKERRFFY